VRLLGKLLGELQQPGAVNILVSAEWVSVRTAILQALAPYPEAGRAVAGALEPPAPGGPADRTTRAAPVRGPADGAR
jgi:hypothetical protein